MSLATRGHPASVATFQFPTITNTNMAAVRTFEVGATLFVGCYNFVCVQLLLKHSFGMLNNMVTARSFMAKTNEPMEPGM
jgi:hypothetical protein